jgi:dsDNA-specific endonuclease/ATPase MutS2
MDNERDEIKDIVAQLKRLQIQETELLQRLEQLSEADRNPSRSPDTTRGFVIGDLVQIKNPRPLQAKKGTIIKIGVATDRITVQAKNGSKIVRASSNIYHIE